MAHPSRRENPTWKKNNPNKVFLKKTSSWTLLFANLNWIVIVTLFLSFWSNLLHISPIYQKSKDKTATTPCKRFKKTKSRTLYFPWFMKSEQLKAKT